MTRPHMTRLMQTLWVLATWLGAAPAWSATYYVSPTGSNDNSGASDQPWLTFSYAINAARASCGDTLVLKDGTYGDGTNTGKLSIVGLECTAGNELTVKAENQRKAKIVDDGSGKAVNITDSAYIIVDGLYARSADKSGVSRGYPFYTTRNHHITLRNLVARNPNRYNNVHVFAIENSEDVLIEDSEGYVFHRHCVEAWKSSRVTARRIYCNPRGGRLSGDNAGGGDALMSMYPCKDCILENSIADATTHGMYLIEMNATFGANILMSGSKVLGSICYGCSYGNGVYLNPRVVADLNHTPQKITVRDVALVDFRSKSSGVRASDGVDITVDHITILGDGGGVGIFADDTAAGSGPQTNSITISNSLATNLKRGFAVSGYNTWSGSALFAWGNDTAFAPAPPADWHDLSTSDPGLGDCKVWIPANSPAKGAGLGGSDIGATILYRSVDGTLTSEPLWNMQTGAFPYGAEDVDGTNRVAGESLFDVHKRLYVNAPGCPFPADYGSADKQAPAEPTNLQVE